MEIHIIFQNKDLHAQTLDTLLLFAQIFKVLPYLKHDVVCIRKWLNQSN